MAARYLSQQDNLGSVAPGRYADLLIVDCDPVSDAREIRKLKSVYRGGVAYDPKALLAQVPKRDIKYAAQGYWRPARDPVDENEPDLTEEMDGLARRESIGEGEQRSEHEQPDDYGPPLRRWQETVWEEPPGAAVVLIAPVVDLQRTAPRAFSAPEFAYVSARLTPFIAAQITVVAP